MPLTLEDIREYAKSEEALMLEVRWRLPQDFLGLAESADALAKYAGKEEVCKVLVNGTEKGTKATPQSIAEFAFRKLVETASDGTRSSSTGSTLVLRYRAKAWADFVYWLGDRGLSVVLT